MSAFLVGKDTIDAILTAWVNLADPHASREGRDLREARAVEVGQLLWTENLRSVQARYRAAECAEMDWTSVAYDVFAPVQFPRDPRPAAQTALVVAIFRLLDCYEYQACEHDDWEASVAARFCRELRAEAATTLPGWREGPWGADGNRDVFVKALAKVDARGAVR